MIEFSLHPRLAADTSFITEWALSRVLLMNDARFPWLVLVPRRQGAIELHDLGPLDRSLLVEEIARATTALKAFAAAAKINVASLGNLVPQLHVHVVARNPGDAAWPGPVWGHGRPVTHDPAQLTGLVAKLAAILA